MPAREAGLYCAACLAGGVRVELLGASLRSSGLPLGRPPLGALRSSRFGFQGLHFRGRAKHTWREPLTLHVSRGSQASCFPSLPRPGIGHRSSPVASPAPDQPAHSPHEQDGRPRGRPQNHSQRDHHDQRFQDNEEKDLRRPPEPVAHQATVDTVQAHVDRAAQDCGHSTQSPRRDRPVPLPSSDKASSFCNAIVMGRLTFYCRARRGSPRWRSSRHGGSPLSRPLRARRSHRVRPQSTYDAPGQPH